jgi:membrane carboxypeptidase/penicillin-binding protein
LKPFVYALGFDAGETPASVLPDVPSSYPTAEPGWRSVMPPLMAPPLSRSK